MLVGFGEGRARGENWDRAWDPLNLMPLLILRVIYMWLKEGGLLMFLFSLFTVSVAPILIQLMSLILHDASGPNDSLLWHIINVIKTIVSLVLLPNRTVSL